jgi:hypothetical protein
MPRQVHPLERQGAIFFPTPPVLEFGETLRGLVESGDTSLICFGQSRGGKSSLFNALVRFGAEQKNAVVFHAAMSGTGDGATSWPRLARELTDSRAGRSPFHSTSNEEALVKRAESEAHELDVHRVLILIDEAQELSTEQLLGLKKFTQVLINRGLSTFVLQFGQPEILAVPNKLASTDRTSLVDRFYLRKHRLRGLRRSEFSLVLACFDTTVWPAPDGPSYTAHYLPELSAHGWKMESLSSHFQRAFQSIAKAHFRDPDDIPIKYLVFAATKLLLNAGVTSSPSADLGSLIEGYAGDSGIVESFEVVGDLEKKVLDKVARPPMPVRRGRG